MEEVYDTGLHVPMTLIRGHHKDGPDVLITSGMRGSGYPGTMACIELAGQIDPREASGRLLMVHPVNVSAFNNRMSAVLPDDGHNFNLQFPGSSPGCLSEILVHWISDLLNKANFYLDLHSGDLYEAMSPNVHYPTQAESEVVNASRAMAKILDVQYMVKSKATTGSYNYAAYMGIPSILIERGGSGSSQREDVSLYKKDIINILKHLNFLPGKPEKPPRPPLELKDIVYLESSCQACWQPEVWLGQWVKNGQPIGRTFDFFDKTIQQYRATHKGVVLYILQTLSTNPGDILLAYGRLRY
jgi:predicted deacylase